jgi:GT2 family glycosyltransferase
MKSGVSIVIPTWNGRPLLQRFLPSVLTAACRFSTQSGTQVEIIIVDDCSTDDTIEWLHQQRLVSAQPEIDSREGAVCTSHFTVRLVKNESNLGFGGACNRGFEAAKLDLVLLLNNDVEVDQDVIARLVENFRDEAVFAAHCRVVNLENGKVCGTAKMGGFSKGFIRVHQSYVPTSRPSAAEPYYSLFAGGGSAMFDRLKLREIGGFEELLSPFYWEDVELSYRAWKRGYTVLFEPAAVVRHQLSSTIRRLDRRTVRKIEQRNRLLYHWIHLHDKALFTFHIFWVGLLLLTAPLMMKPGFILSAVDALRVLPQVRKRRREEKALSVRTDRDVIALFEALSERPDLMIYDDIDRLDTPATVNREHRL